MNEYLCICIYDHSTPKGIKIRVESLYEIPYSLMGNGLKINTLKPEYIISTY